MKAQNSDQSKVKLMQYRKLFSALVLVLLLSSCSRTGAGTAESNDSTIPGPSGKATFSAAL